MNRNPNRISQAILIVVALVSMTINIHAQGKRTQSNQKDTVEQSYCWKVLPVTAYSYIDSLGCLKWVYCDEIKQVASRYTTFHKQGKYWMATTWEFNDEFTDLDMYYINNVKIRPVEIKLKPNFISGYTGYFKTLPK